MDRAKLAWLDEFEGVPDHYERREETVKRLDGDGDGDKSRERGRDGDGDGDRCEERDRDGDGDSNGDKNRERGRNGDGDEDGDSNGDRCEERDRNRDGDRRGERDGDGDGDDGCMLAYMYLLRRHKPFMLQLPMLEEYSSQGAHGLPYNETDDLDLADDIEEGTE